VDVTTVQPSPFNTTNIRIVIGGDGSWYPVPVGGLALVSAFQVNSLSRTAWVFPGNLRPNDPLHPLFVAAAATHEAGHTFGLEHQSTYGPNGQLLDRYNRGDEFKAPFMGASYRKRGLWWKGPNELGSHNIQDDLAMLAGPANGFGYRPDDHANTLTGATPLMADGADWIGWGVIERTSDVDFFSFDALGGEMRFDLYVAPWGPMLDASLALYSSAGSLLEFAGTPSLGETIFATLDPGMYYLAVSSAGNYGDIGQYTLVASVPEPASLAVLGLAALLIRRRA
jgi:hypothetical protein